MYTITRQMQWGTNESVVEVSSGGIDYANPNALVAKYSGEFEEYKDPRKAVEVAIAIVKAWRKDGERKAKIGVGYTGGMVMPFEPETFAYARAWAKKEYEGLGKCPSCGKIFDNPKEWYQAGFLTQEGDFLPYDDGFKYCSEYCAEKESCFEEEEKEE